MVPKIPPQISKHELEGMLNSWWQAGAQRTLVTQKVCVYRLIQRKKPLTCPSLLSQSAKNKKATEAQQVGKCMRRRPSEKRMSEQFRTELAAMLAHCAQRCRSKRVSAHLNTRPPTQRTQQQGHGLGSTCQIAEYHSPGKEARLLHKPAHRRVGLEEVTVEPPIPAGEAVLMQRMGVC